MSDVVKLLSLACYVNYGAFEMINITEMYMHTAVDQNICEFKVL